MDDMLIVGSSVLTARITEILKDRFPLTEGSGDYLGLEIDTSPGVIHVHQGHYVEKAAETSRYDGCKPACTPITTYFAGTDRGAPADADAGTATRLDFRGANGQVGYGTASTSPCLLFALGILSSVEYPPAVVSNAPAP